MSTVKEWSNCWHVKGAAGLAWRRGAKQLPQPQSYSQDPLGGEWEGKRKKAPQVCLLLRILLIQSNSWVARGQQITSPFSLTFRTKGGQQSKANISITVAWSGNIVSLQIYYKQFVLRKNVAPTGIEHIQWMIELLTCEGSSWTCLKKRFQTAATAILLTTGTHL